MRSAHVLAAGALLLAGCGPGAGAYRVAPLPLPDWAEAEVDPGYRLAGGFRVEHAGEPRRLAFVYEVWEGSDVAARGEWPPTELTAPADVVARLDAEGAAVEVATLHPEGAIPQATVSLPLPPAFPTEGRGIATAILVPGETELGSDELAPVFGVRRGPTITPGSGFEGPFHDDETVLVVRMRLEP